MGVIACDRKDCDNIMCDFYSDTFGYLCYSCKTELIALGPVDIYAFMGSVKPMMVDKHHWEDIVDEEFSER